MQRVKLGLRPLRPLRERRGADRFCMHLYDSKSLIRATETFWPLFLTHVRIEVAGAFTFLLALSRLHQSWENPLAPTPKLQLRRGDPMRNSEETWSKMEMRARLRYITGSPRTGNIPSMRPLSRAQRLPRLFTSHPYARLRPDPPALVAWPTSPPSSGMYWLIWLGGRSHAWHQ
ncbi:hypothetical protein BC826DRAFT_569677 [Russula brevipes]|nr:hypothetical protein BC826DRAFT_569677 [Russula brevipes]